MKYTQPILIVTIIFLALLLSQKTQAATFTVVNTADAGAGSLRQAILDSNSNSGIDTINFNIGSGVQTQQILGQTSKVLSQDPTLSLRNTNETDNPSLHPLLKSKLGESEIKASLDRLEKNPYRETGKSYKRKMSSTKKTLIFVGIGQSQPF